MTRGESMKKIKKITGKELDLIFDEGKEDVLQYFDTKNVRSVCDNLKYSGKARKAKRYHPILPEYNFPL
jgi:hypothetical protein